MTVAHAALGPLYISVICCSEQLLVVLQSNAAGAISALEADFYSFTLEIHDLSFPALQSAFGLNQHDLPLSAVLKWLPTDTGMTLRRVGQRHAS